jgi:hypothetical protein
MAARVVIAVVLLAGGLVAARWVTGGDVGGSVPWPVAVAIVGVMAFGAWIGDPSHRRR